MPLLFFTHNNRSNRRRRGCACAGACAHTARSNADLSSATGKKYTAPHTQRQRETRTHALGASRATTRRERCVSRAIMSDESFVFDFKVSFRTSGYILSFQIFPSLLRVAASSYFLTPSPDATPDAHATRSHRRRHASKTTRVLRKALERSSRC